MFARAMFIWRYLLCFRDLNRKTNGHFTIIFFSPFFKESSNIDRQAISFQISYRFLFFNLLTSEKERTIVCVLDMHDRQI